MADNTTNHDFYLPENGEDGYGDDKNSDWADLDTLLNGMSSDGTSWSGQSINTQSVSNIEYVSPTAPNSLPSEIDAAMDRWPSDGGRVYIPPRDDGEAWNWDTDWTISPGAWSGIELVFTRGTQIEYDGSGWTITLDASGDTSANQGFGSTIDIIGGDWRSTGSATGWCRCLNTKNALISPQYVGYYNSTGDGVSVRLENTNGKWAEGNTIQGRFRSDIGIQTRVNGGTESFVDTKILNSKFHYNSLGLDLEGETAAVALDHLTFFPQESNSTAILFNGQHSGMVVNQPRFDTTGGSGDSLSGTVVCETGEHFEGLESYRTRPPMLFGGAQAGFDTLAKYAEPTHEIYWSSQSYDYYSTPDNLIVGRGLFNVGLLDEYLADDIGDGKYQGRDNRLLGAYLTQDNKACKSASVRPQWIDEGDVSPTVSDGAIEFLGRGRSLLTRPTELTVGTWEFEAAHLTENGTGEYITVCPVREGPANKLTVRLADNGSAGISGDGKITLSKVNSNGKTDLINTNWTVDTSFHTIRLTRDASGNFELFMDGTSVGTATDTYLPTLEQVDVSIGADTYTTKDSTQAIRNIHIY